MCNKKEYGSYSLPVNTIYYLDRLKIKLENKRMTSVTREQMIIEAITLLIEREKIDPEELHVN